MDGLFKSTAWHAARVVYLAAGWLGKPLRRMWRGLYSLWVSQRFGCGYVRFLPWVSEIRHPECFRIGRGTSVGRMAVLTAWPQPGEPAPCVMIGERCSLGDFIHLTASNRIEIGDDVLTGRWVTISDNAHGSTCRESLDVAPVARRVVSKGPVRIGARVWIGDKATILPGVEIGEGSVIAANAVVTRSIPPYCVAGGNPARIIKQIES